MARGFSIMISRNTNILNIRDKIGILKSSFLKDCCYSLVKSRQLDFLPHKDSKVGIKPIRIAGKRAR